MARAIGSVTMHPFIGKSTQQHLDSSNAVQCDDWACEFTGTGIDQLITATSASAQCARHIRDQH